MGLVHASFVLQLILDDPCAVEVGSNFGNPPFIQERSEGSTPLTQRLTYPSPGQGGDVHVPQMDIPIRNIPSWGM